VSLPGLPRQAADAAALAGLVEASFADALLRRLGKNGKLGNGEKKM